MRTIYGGFPFVVMSHPNIVGDLGHVFVSLGSVLRLSARELHSRTERIVWESNYMERLGF